VKIKILPSALADLDRGRIFYARQSKGIGDYFLDSLFSDIDSLELYAGVHIKVFDFHRPGGISGALPIDRGDEPVSVWLSRRRER